MMMLKGTSLIGQFPSDSLPCATNKVEREREKELVLFGMSPEVQEIKKEERKRKVLI
jgi:hypothetical protein